MLENEDAPLAVAKLSLPYKLRYMAATLDWALQVAGLNGASAGEANQLRLALEETLSFLINSYHDAEPWELICVDFTLKNDNIAEFCIANEGPPIHQERIPRYDPQDGSGSDMDGLWYFVALKAVDDIKFNNLGNRGWQVVITKRLEQGLGGEATAPQAHASGTGTTPAFTVRYAKPEDAGELIDITYDTYRYTHPNEVFYHESRLAEAIAKEEIIFTVVESGGTIACTDSISVLPYAPGCGYVGALMSRRAYRKTRAVLHLLNENKRYMESNPLGLDLYTSTTVTAHTGSQKAGEKIGFKPSGLFLNEGSVINFRNMRATDGIRESFVVYVYISKKPTLETMYLPEAHHDVVRPILAHMGCEATLSAECCKELPADTVLDVKTMSIEKSAQVTLVQIGKDWAESLRRKFFTLRGEGIQAITVLVPAFRPLPENLDGEMARLNGLFTGLTPLSTSDYYLVYCILNEPMDFDRIQVASPLMQALKEHIMQSYRQMSSELL
ncbi:MAG: hypothetical protein JW942_09510 [Opitutales bacterium]|nr:hypothetical protein [Opitutales bacterium]